MDFPSEPYDPGFEMRSLWEGGPLVKLNASFVRLRNDFWS